MGSRVHFLFFYPLLFSFFLGCGNGLAGVAGRVTFNGQPVEEGEIRFVGSGSGASSSGQVTGAAILNGQYELPPDKGAAPGSYRVEIRAEKKTGKKLPAIPPAPPGTMYEETVSFIPAKYNDQSNLTLDLKAGRNTKDFELTP